MQYTLSTSKCNSNEPNKRFLAIPYENVSNIKKPKILNSDANRIIFLHSTVDWVLHGKILSYFDGKVFLKLRQNVRKRKSKFILESIVVFSSSAETFFFFWSYPLPFFLKVYITWFPCLSFRKFVTFQICRQDTCREFSLSFCKAHCTILNTAEVVF